MAYEPYNWTTASYVNPGNMNHLEQGVAGASTTAEKAASDITKTNKDLTDLSGVVTTLNSKLLKSKTYTGNNIASSMITLPAEMDNIEIVSAVANDLSCTPFRGYNGTKWCIRFGKWDTLEKVPNGTEYSVTVYYLE